jgi:hypothetical protein
MCKLVVRVCVREREKEREEEGVCVLFVGVLDHLNADTAFGRADSERGGIGERSQAPRLVLERRLDPLCVAQAKPRYAAQTRTLSVGREDAGGGRGGGGTRTL